MDINDKLLKEIENYCNFNNIENIEEEINNMLRVGFNIIRYGTKPFDNNKELKEIEKEIVIKKTTKTKKKIEEEVSEQLIEDCKNNEIIESQSKTKKVRIIKNK